MSSTDAPGSSDSRPTYDPSLGPVTKGGRVNIFSTHDATLQDTDSVTHHGSTSGGIDKERQVSAQGSSTTDGERISPSKQRALDEGKVILTESDCYSELGFSFSTRKKWWILTVMFIVQVSMNFNTSLYSNGIDGISQEFGVSLQAARCGAMIFLILYAFGCELWAPWSEEFGRWPVLQLSLFMVNLFQLPVALANNFATILVGRAIGGLMTGGGSLTLGVIADMFEPEKQQYAVAYIVFSSVGGRCVTCFSSGFRSSTDALRFCARKLQYPGPHRWRLYPSQPELAMVHLGATDLWRLRSGASLPDCARDPHGGVDRSHRQEAPSSGRRGGGVWPERVGAVEGEVRIQGDCPDLVEAFQDVPHW